MEKQCKSNIAATETSTTGVLSRSIGGQKRTISRVQLTLLYIDTMIDTEGVSRTVVRRTTRIF